MGNWQKVFPNIERASLGKERQCDITERKRERGGEGKREKDRDNDKDEDEDEDGNGNEDEDGDEDRSSVHEVCIFYEMLVMS